MVNADGCSTPLCGRLSPTTRQVSRLAHLVPLTLEAQLVARVEMPYTPDCNNLVHDMATRPSRQIVLQRANLRERQPEVQDEGPPGKDTRVVYIQEGDCSQPAVAACY